MRFCSLFVTLCPSPTCANQVRVQIGWHVADATVQRNLKQEPVKEHFQMKEFMFVLLYEGVCA